MQSQDTTFNYKIVIAALVAGIIAILIAFYYSHAQGKNQVRLLENEKKLLVKDLSLMKAEVDRISGLNEVNDIELQSSKFEIDQLIDSIGRLNFSIGKLKEDRHILRALESRIDSLKEQNNLLNYTNNQLASNYERTKREIDELRGRTSTLEEAEAEARRKNQELADALKVKNYLNTENARGYAFRLRSGRPSKTTKASVVEKLQGCVTILGNPNERGDTKVVYFQFLSPEMSIIENNSDVVNVSGNTYSKRVEFIYMGKDIEICDAITVEEGSLYPGIYTLNVFENERLLSSSEFQLK